MAPSSKGDPYLSARPSMNLRSMSPETRKQLSAMVKRIVADSVSVPACSCTMPEYNKGALWGGPLVALPHTLAALVHLLWSLATNTYILQSMAMQGS